LVSRGIADVVDAVLAVLILSAGYVAFSAVLFVLRPRTFSFPAPNRVASLLIAAAVVVGYLAFGWYVTGRTPGKQLVGLRVVTDQGTPLSVPLAIARAILNVIFPVGLIWTAFSSKNASALDLVLRTSVVYDWRKRTAKTSSMEASGATSKLAG
jgi:uncharacterized RDD family membrane protein YckC